MSKDLDISNYDCSDLMKLFKINKLHGSYEQTEKMCKKIDSKFEQPYQEFYKKGKKILNVLEKAFENEETMENINAFIKKITNISNFIHYSDNDLIDLIMERTLRSYHKTLNQFSVLNDPNYNVNKFTPGYNNENNTNPIASSYPNSVAPGFLNPLKRITLTHNINLNSCFRHNYYKSDPADFLYTFPSDIKHVLSIRLVSIELPNSWYLISEKNRNNYFQITMKEEQTDHIFNILVPDGNYDIDTLSYFLNTTYFYLSANDTLLKHIEFKINNFNFKSSFKLLENNHLYTFSIKFVNNLNQNFMNTMGWLMGFRLANYIDVDKELISEGLFDAGGDRYVYVAIDDFQYNNNTLNSVFFDKGILNENVIAKIPMSNGKLSLIVSEDTNPLSKIRKYTGPINISKLQIKLLDKFGNVIDLNNMDYSLTLELETLYESFNFKNVIA